MVMCTTRGRKRVVFHVKADPGSEVCVAGSFNGWQRGRKVLRDEDGSGRYTGALLLQPGRYEYKLIVNGIWTVDPDCPDWVANEYGSLNSVLEVA